MVLNDANDHLPAFLELHPYPCVSKLEDMDYTALLASWMSACVLVQEPELYPVN